MTEDLALLQEVGIYRYRHPLTDAVAYEKVLGQLHNQIELMAKKEGVLCSQRLTGRLTGRSQKAEQWFASIPSSCCGHSMQRLILSSAGLSLTRSMGHSTG